jgi:DNA-binding transcriptional LysR family regulator
MAVHFDDLQLLLDILDCGSFSQAAARRGWSQPQVSQRVHALEADIGATLFQRHRRGATPTAACDAFVDAGREALAALERGRKAVQGTPALPKMTLECLPSLAPIVFSPLLGALAGAAMEIRCVTDHSQAVMEHLLAGTAQFGFVLRCPPIAGIHMEGIRRSSIVAVVKRSHKLARAQGPLLLADIANERLAPQHWGDGCDDLIRRVRTHRSAAGPIHSIQPASAAVDLALQHGFLTFMPEMAIERELRAGQLIKLEIADLPQWEWELMVAWRGGKRPDAAKQQVLDAVRALAAGWRDAPGD